MESEYNNVGKNNVRQIAVDFSCEFKHLQSAERASQEPKQMAIHGKLGAKLASDVGPVYFASADRMERSILCGGLIMAISLFFPLQIRQRCVLRFPWHQHGNLTHTPTVPWSHTDGTCAHWGQCHLQMRSLLLEGA